MSDLDDKDMMILRTLNRNSRLSTYQISKMTGIPTTTVHNRIKRLEDEKVIKGYTVDVDYGKLNREVVVYLLTTYDMNKMEKAGMSLNDLTKTLRKIQGIETISYVTGRFDVILKVRLRNINQLSKVVLDKLRKVQGVIRTESVYALHHEMVRRF